MDPLMTGHMNENDDDDEYKTTTIKINGTESIIIFYSVVYTESHYIQLTIPFSHIYNTSYASGFELKLLMVMMMNIVKYSPSHLVLFSMDRIIIIIYFFLISSQDVSKFNIDRIQYFVLMLFNA